MDSICDVLRDLVPFEQFKNVKNTHGEVLLSATDASMMADVFY